MDCPSGMRKITTFRKLPTMEPNTNAMNPRKISIGFCVSPKSGTMNPSQAVENRMCLKYYRRENPVLRAPYCNRISAEHDLLRIPEEQSLTCFATSHRIWKDPRGHATRARPTMSMIRTVRPDKEIEVPRKSPGMLLS